MSFYTSLTGLNASSAQLGITANNVSNVGTVGFKKSRAEFGDIFATSPLENASSAIGQGVLLKKVNQQFSQGNIEFSSNSLDMAISGQGFFALKPKLTSNNYAYTRAGSFSVNNDRYVVDSSGQYLQTFPVNDDGSVIATGLESASSLQLPSTSGLPVASSKIILGLNLPAGADILSKTKFTEDNPYRFDRTNSDTFNKSTSITLYDSLGNPHIATVYYIKTTSATEEESTNKWDTRIFIGDHELEPKLITSKNDKSETMYMNEFGQVSPDPSLDDPTFNPNGAHPLYFKDEQNVKINSERAALSGGFMSTDLGHDFGSTDENRITFRNGSTSSGKGVQDGTNYFSISIDGSDPKAISVPSGEYTGTLLAAEMTKQANAAFGDEKYMKLPEADAKRQITISMQTKDGTYYNTNAENGGTTVQIDRYFDASTTPPTNFTLEQLIRQVKDRVRESGLPVDVEYNTRTRAFKFTASDSDFIKIKAGSGLGNEFGLSATPSFAIDSLPYEGGQIAPKGDTILDTNNQRAGILIEYNKDSRKFTFSSGSSGSPSKVSVGVPSSTFVDKAVGATAGTTGALAAIPGVTTLSFPATDTLTGASMGTLKAIFPGGAAHQYTVTWGFTNATPPVAITADTQALALARLAGLIAAGESTIATAVLNTAVIAADTTTGEPGAAIGTRITFTGDAAGGTLSRGNYSISSGTLTSAVMPRAVLATVGKAFNPPAPVVVTAAATSPAIVPGVSSINFSGLDLVDGDRVALAMAADFTVPSLILHATFDTDLATTIKNLAADMALEDTTFTSVSLANNIVSFTGPTDGTAVTAVTVKVESETLSDTGQTKVGSVWKSNSAAGQEYATSNHILGIGESYDKEAVLQVGTGLTSTSGSAEGSKAGVDISGTFSVLAENGVNIINVTIDGIDGAVAVPPGSYTGTTFAKALEERINLIRSATGHQVSGVKVDFDLDGQSFKITSGTVGPESFVNVNGSSNWGLSNSVQVRGDTPTITVIKQATDTEGNKLFIDLDGNETTVPPKVMPTWSPIYLDKGELTYDTFGKLVSPKEGVIYSPYDPDNGSNLLNLSVDYGKNSTQYSAPFSVLSLSQDGFPSGRLDGLGIDSSGVVRANYTNGNQVALGKLILANFANPNGLKQVGNANYVATTNSGAPVLGEAGGDGYGTIQGGALERANVDLTEELVNLITAQRNFQANAKAIETSSTLTQTIINIRG
jgi:flagellar hook protein FlgE